MFKKLHEFKNYLSTLDNLLDLFCIQESHLTPKYQPSIPHYHVIRKDRPSSNGKDGGLMVCVRQTLDFYKLDVTLPGSSNLEILGIAVHAFYIFKIYNPPSNPLTSTSLYFLSNFAKVILCGDLMQTTGCGEASTQTAVAGPWWKLSTYTIWLF